ncbi:uncharacterized protein KGF55_002327 [Candida pseudojiufengensis]|uniref:uncharacterized protein n=1 Tax=Candida pseudojiufengensis TaxID=497109 RepID=UPI0022254CAE|nr:uncharacterized protein KGF55_002327 [Candida pseudojiufengensis]KAI5963447.1 hypothetical protein KGF55_002327 [Candida pseudojiufengensis]
MSRTNLEHHNTLKLKKPRVSKVNPLNPSTNLSECFKKVSTSLYVSLAPKFINDPISGIKQQHLDPLIMTYYPKVKGIILSYSNIKLLTKSQGQNLAKIEGASPFTFIWVNVDFLIWSPCVGDTLEGDIYMQTPSHIGLLICDVFNASIKKYNIPMDWSFTPSQEDEEDNKRTFGYWTDDLGDKIDGKLKFTVKAIYTTGRVVSIEGTLIKPGEERNSQPVYKEKSSQNKVDNTTVNTHKKFDDDEEEEKDKSQVLPTYEESGNDDEDYKIVNNSDSVEDEVESD